MILVPRKYKNKKTFRLKKKKKYNYKNKIKGDAGIFLKKYLFITLPVLNKFLRILKFFFKRKKKNYKFFLINYNFNNIFSKKTKGSRMGKGKGRYLFWISKLKPGDFFLDFLNYRAGKIYLLIKKLNTFFFNKFYFKNINFFYTYI